MPIIIEHNTMTPIYEQIVNQLRQQIVTTALKTGDALPSVRAMARDLQISALTVKKAYDQLEADGLIKTVQGKGSFVAAVDPTVQQEFIQRDLEEKLQALIIQARQNGISDQQFQTLVSILLEEAH
ncbi:GntR family transcriptional regulator [Lacticaseibacillus manihotivorans]|jgi:GntR family transcriptional regulator|uniref:HTH gntR-type domain-containing protein n=2 Tax=Lacticaseibacillus manihotivorans TaxID=88233 RepID=A0A0R1QPY9_9LACO|nr:GntR family transcriptional regulator [Lacticaseibacillus manihotivorans]KRL44346.1 hypothetical protein FD01_GL001178 [Lacticaseibacillus manihotivorans DSM 13343 = JCM 12514]QFQ91730.1 GntR family transcriptional regulator [Lacticaseibacillus manihotivorans]